MIWIWFTTESCIRISTGIWMRWANRIKSGSWWNSTSGRKQNIKVFIHLMYVADNNNLKKCYLNFFLQLCLLGKWGNMIWHYIFAPMSLSLLVERSEIQLLTSNNVSSPFCMTISAPSICHNLAYCI